MISNIGIVLGIGYMIGVYGVVYTTSSTPTIGTTPTDLLLYIGRSMWPFVR